MCDTTKKVHDYFFRCVLQERFSNSSNFENLFTMVELLHLIVVQNVSVTYMNIVFESTHRNSMTSCAGISRAQWVEKRSITIHCTPSECNLKRLPYYVTRLIGLIRCRFVVSVIKPAISYLLIQELSWPSISVEEAKRALKLKKLFTLHETAKVVKEVFEKLRSPK